MKIYPYLLILLLSLVLARCTKPETHATASLEGTWKVDSLFILYINKTFTGSSGTDSIYRSSGEVGTFYFTHEMVKYDYKRRNTQLKANLNYTLRTFKENAGFAKVRKWEIILPDKTYNTEFGDQTSDAHKKARNLTLTYEPKAIGKQEMEIIHLSKR